MKKLNAGNFSDSIEKFSDISAENEDQNAWKIPSYPLCPKLVKDECLDYTNRGFMIFRLATGNN
jgi:hypothetical protein